MNKQKIENMLTELCGRYAVSGTESGISEYIRGLFEPYADSIETDALGSLIIHKKCAAQSGRKARKIMIDAHMDEVGLMVTEIDEKGFLKFTNVGGIDERILPASEVVVHGKRDICGVIGIKPPHLQTADENKKTLKIKELAIDIGMNEKQAKELVQIGDTVSYTAHTAKLLNNQIASKSLDDRASVCALLYAAEKLSKEQTADDVYFVISVREETNLSGAKCAAYSINPDCALVVDVTHGKTPDNAECDFEVGKCLSYSLGPNIYTPLARLIKTVADEKSIDVREEVDGGSTGTNAWSVQTSRNGVAAAVLSLPLKYMHTPTEVVSINDIADAGEIIYGFIKKLGSENDILNTFETGWFDVT